jgi:hypothetical protein
MARTGDVPTVRICYFLPAMLKDKLSRLTAINIGKLFDQALKENEDTVCNLNRDQMYEEGVLNVNRPQIEKYSPATIRAKRKAPFNKTDFITLKWFGKFHASLKLLIFKEYFVISSDNLIWANFLEPQNRFSSALGLTKESKGKLRDLMRDEIIKKIKDVA